MRRERPANFIYLLLGLLVILVAGPIVYEFTQQRMALVTQIAFSTTLIIGIWTLLDSRKWFIAGVAIVVADLALTAAYITTRSDTIDVLTILLEMAFCVMSLVFALRYVLFGERMDANRIVGAICVYLLLGIVFGQLNGLIYMFSPDSFRGFGETETELAGFTLIYYSFVTMTTLGYGDVTPDGALARVLAYLAAIAGQFYIAILVAMVVAQYLRQKDGERRND